MANQESRAFFFPFLSPGDMIPCLYMVTLFARHGVSVTIVTTPGNEPFVRPTLLRSAAAISNPIDLLLISFPSTVHHLLPSDGKDNLSSAPFASSSDFFHAAFSLQQPLFDLLRLHRPNCLLFDINYQWAADIARDLSIPSLVFCCPCLSLCIENSLELIHTPSQNLDTFVVQDLPHRIELASPEIPESFLVLGLQGMRRESKKKSLNIIVNSFYELESRPENSVPYVCFGSLWEFSNKQLDEIAAALGASGYPLIWVAAGA